MHERSATRAELERSLRAVLPDQAALNELKNPSPPAVTAVGVGGLLTGYVWGWLRGRRSRKKRRR